MFQKQHMRLPLLALAIFSWLCDGRRVHSTDRSTPEAKGAERLRALLFSSSGPVVGSRVSRFGRSRDMQTATVGPYSTRFITARLQAGVATKRNAGPSTWAEYQAYRNGEEPTGEGAQENDDQVGFGTTWAEYQAFRGKNEQQLPSDEPVMGELAFDEASQPQQVDQASPSSWAEYQTYLSGLQQSPSEELEQLPPQDLPSDAYEPQAAYQTAELQATDYPRFGDIGKKEQQQASEELQQLPPQDLPSDDAYEPQAAYQTAELQATEYPRFGDIGKKEQQQQQQRPSDSVAPDRQKMEDLRGPGPYSSVNSAYELLGGAASMAEELQAKTTKLLNARTARVFLPLAGITGFALASLLQDDRARDLPGADALGERARALSIDPAAENSMNKFFPGSCGASMVDHQVAAVLEQRGYTKANTLFATSTCPDEINSEPGDLIELMKSRWGENFGLGGLAGVPFVGKAGISAYAHHVPDSGKMLILFAPHVGIDMGGGVGTLKRLNQQSTSTACGATIGAYNGIVKDALANTAVDPLTAMTPSKDFFDVQIDYIKKHLRSRIQGIDSAPDPIVYITYQMYAIVREFLIDAVLMAGGVWDDAEEICMLGGIMVNRGQGGDRFMPLFFQSRKGPDGAVEDLYNEAFGNQPDLSFVLGDKAKAKNFLKYDLKTLSKTKPSELTADQEYETMQKKKAAEMVAADFKDADRVMPTTADDTYRAQVAERVDALLAQEFPSVEDYIARLEAHDH